MNPDEYVDIGAQWIALFCNKNEIVYLDLIIVLVMNMFLKKLKEQKHES